MSETPSTETETQIDTQTETPSARAPAPAPATPSLIEHLLDRRPDVRRRILLWSGIFVFVLALFLLMANLEDLRMFDPVFLPALFLLVVATLIFGYVIGHARGMRYCRRWSEKQLEGRKK